MSKTWYVITYGCRICLRIYTKKEDAEACCEKEERVRPFYECGECGVRHTTLEDVKECCQAAE
jgi:hypothetical protein